MNTNLDPDKNGITFTHDDRVYSNFSLDDAVNVGITESEYNEYEFAYYQEEKAIELIAACQYALDQLTASYPRGEVSTFYKQEQEADAFLSDNNAETPFLDVLSNTREVPKGDLVATIKAKSQMFAQASSAIIGKRKKLVKALTDLSYSNNSLADIANIKW